MERLSGLDAEFLHLEDGIAHMHIAGVSVFEGPTPSIDDLYQLIEAKLDLIPRYRRRVQTVPLEFGRPVWVDDPHFNLSYHIRHTALPAPGSDVELCRLMGRLMSQELDRDRPLWETWMVEGLPRDQWALITKVHHCMVDGVSGVDLLAVLLDIDRVVELPEPEAWTPAAAPSGPALVLDAWHGLASDLWNLARRVPDATRDPLRVVRSARRGVEGVLALGRSLTNTPPLTIEGTIGPHRVWCHSATTLDAVSTIRKAFGGTVNDVVLAACAGGYRALLQHRDEDPDTAVVRTLVPVSLRSEDAHGVLDNRVSVILYALPVHIVDPVQRLERVHEDMQTLKGSHMADAGEALATMGDFVPPMVVGTVSRLATRVMHRLPQRSVNTVTTNVPGPQFPLYCLGREMLAYYPYVPLSHGVRIGTAILSYNGHLTFGVTGDFDAAPDLAVLADSIADGVAELRELAAAIELVEDAHVD